MNIVLNGQPREFRDGGTISELLDQMQIERRGVAVEVNCEVVPRQRHGEYRLSEGDRLEVVTLVGGG